ncbi:MAG TPA: tRNA (adenosine(37)-N6)-threonylcarbamoyltransferase complex ATPase subunit type 1 TsaE [Herpetosiphonaceae bacterium]
MSQRLSAVLDPDSIDVISHSPQQTIRIGQRIGSLLKAGDRVLLFGTFGAGKTHISKGFAAAFGVDQSLVTSPTFVIVNEYEGDAAHQRMRINHIDLYRLESGAADFESIGLDELWDDEAICIIEWAERMLDALPPEYLAIRFDYLSETKRLMRITPRGPRYQQLVSLLRQTAFAG